MKLPFIEKAMQSKFFGAREPEGLLPVGFGFLFRMIYSLGMIGATYILLIRWKRSSAGKILEIRHNSEIFRWLLYLTIVLSSTFFVLIIGQLLHLSRIFEQYRIPSLTVTLTIFFICSYLLFKPNILYGLEGWLPIQVTADLPEMSSAISEPVTKSQSISLEQGMEYKRTIEDHFKKNLPFLKHRYTIRDLSNEVEIPSYLLSAFINQEYGKNFSEFVNENRISYLIEFAAQNPDSLLQYTLEVLGQMGGFKSRAAFIAAVKRKTGKTPSEVFGNRS
jgi:AraC-like DNA-binding protein